MARSLFDAGVLEEERVGAGGDTFTSKLRDEPLNDESSTASLGSVSVKPESALLPPLPVDRHFPVSVPGTAGAANDTLWTAPAARSNSLLILVVASRSHERTFPTASSREDTCTAIPTATTRASPRRRTDFFI
ncbi:MAG: hypothetical protein ACREF4_09490 [Gammaproteobacteria bacterium]